MTVNKIYAIDAIVINEKYYLIIFNYYLQLLRTGFN